MLVIRLVPPLNGEEGEVRGPMLTLVDRSTGHAAGMALNSSTSRSILLDRLVGVVLGVVNHCIDCLQGRWLPPISP